MSTTVIVNPQARNGMARSRWRKFAPILRNSIGEFAERLTGGKGDAIELARDAIEAGASRIIVFGGDGTISEVANGMLNSNNPACRLGIIPFGTGNDFCRSLGIDTNPQKALEILARDRIRSVDAGQVEFTGSDGRRCKRMFMNAASLGLSPEVNRLVDRHGHWFGKRWSGKLCYLIATLVAKSRFQPVCVRITSGCGREQTDRVLAVVLANGKYFGGGIQIARRASPDDGRLYAVVVQPIGFARLMFNIKRCYVGDLMEMEEFDGFHTSQLTVSPVDGSPVQIELDGEVVGQIPATFRVLPMALRVIA